MGKVRADRRPPWSLERAGCAWGPIVFALLKWTAIGRNFDLKKKKKQILQAVIHSSPDSLDDPDVSGVMHWHSWLSVVLFRASWRAFSSELDNLPRFALQTCRRNGPKPPDSLELI